MKNSVNEKKHKGAGETAGNLPEGRRENWFYRVSSDLHTGTVACVSTQTHAHCDG